MDPLVLQIRENIAQVQSEIEIAAKRSSRKAEDVKLIVVSKAQPVEKLIAAYEAGVRLFGENYPEETAEKIEQINPPLNGVEWHMIGHLQSRKIPIIVKHFSYLHSLDSFSLAEKLSKKLPEDTKSLNILLEVTVSGEESKFGFSAQDEAAWPLLVEEVQKIAGLAGLNLCGLMTMPPFFDDPEEARPYFVKAKKLLEFLQSRLDMEHFTQLSMGTSGDYAVAVEEGATYVRVGQAIMGQRIYKK